MLLVLGFAAADGGHGGDGRLLLFVLLVLAILFLLAGAIIAVVALRIQQKDARDAALLEQFKDEIY